MGLLKRLGPPGGGPVGDPLSLISAAMFGVFDFDHD